MKRKICPICNTELSKKDKFCTVCGKKLSKGKGKRILQGLLAVLLIMVITATAAVAVFLSRYFNEYNKQMRLADGLLRDEHFVEAAYAYEAAAKIEPMEAEAYMGQATAMVQIPDIDLSDAESVSKILVNGYERTKNLDLIFHFKKLAKITKNNENVFFSHKFENDYFRYLPEDITEKDVSVEDIIYADCVRAYDFWYDWIYCQKYVDMTETDYSIMPYRAKVTHKEINTKKKLENEIKRHFSESLSKQFIKSLNPQNEDVLYINCCGDMGDRPVQEYDHSFIKVSDDKYMLTIRLYCPYEYDFDSEIPETKLEESKILCTFNGEKWIFDNHSGVKYFDLCYISETAE
ncbi:MAG: hypothetical protein IJ285_05425 [Clostridia bacterium]|nr:hypothetical protein [Clostridia bacterium]